jgi:hypothetical protein
MKNKEVIAKPPLSEQGLISLLAGLSVACLAVAWFLAFSWAVHRCICLVIIGTSTLIFAGSLHVRRKGLIHFLPADTIDALFNQNLATVGQEFSRWLMEPTGFGQFVALFVMPMDAAGVRATIANMPIHRRSIATTRGLKNLLSPQAQAWLFPRSSADQQPPIIEEVLPNSSNSRSGAPIMIAVTAALEPPVVEELLLNGDIIGDLRSDAVSEGSRGEEPQPPSPERAGTPRADGWDVPEEDWIELPVREAAADDDDAEPVVASSGDASNWMVKSAMDYWATSGGHAFVSGYFAKEVDKTLRRVPLFGHFFDSHSARIVGGTLAGSAALTLAAQMMYSPYARKWGSRWRHFMGDIAMFGAASLSISFGVLSVGSLLLPSLPPAASLSQRKTKQAPLSLSLLQRLAASKRARALVAMAIIALWVARLRQARLRHLFVLVKDLIAKRTGNNRALSN